MAQYKTCIQKLTNYVFPKMALRMQKRYMRRQMRKPREMTIRSYVARVQELNSYLKSFPPFGDNQELPEDKILDILEFSVPHSWSNEFICTGFDPIQNTVRRVH